MFNNNKRLNENFFNSKLQNYEINNFDLCITKIWALEQALINSKYNSIFTDKYIEIDYYALFKAQLNLKDAIMASYMTYKDLILVSLNPFKSQDYYVNNLIYPFSVTKRYPYSNMPYPNGFQSINEFVDYKMDYDTFLQLVIFNFDLCTDKLLKNMHNYFLKLDLKFHEHFYYSFDIKTQKLIYIERIKHSFNPIELNIPMPPNILTPVSIITNKLITNPEIFSFKLFFAKANVVFLYPILFPLNKLFNISNPISFEMFSYSLLYFIKLKFLF